MTVASHRSYYDAEIAEFKGADTDAVLGKLTAADQYDLTPAQTGAWKRQIDLMKSGLSEVDEGWIFFEYKIPRMGKRVDNIVVAGATILVIEFKVGAEREEKAAVDQVVDYALDLKNFHAESHKATIVPILVATEGPGQRREPVQGAGQVYGVLSANGETLAQVIREALSLGEGADLEPEAWRNSGYRPTPTIIEASQVLYRGHRVEDITRSEAGADNLGATAGALNQIIDAAKKNREKAICLVTGVPGAGKTLAGLNLANERRQADEDDTEHAVFLSGNGPLVAVLQEALARDEVQLSREGGTRITKDDAKRKAKAFIQNIHHFRDDCLESEAAPIERVVVFDEAQRAWDREATSDFMQRKRGLPSFDQSEPEFLIGVMDRHTDWAVIVCLIGEGQEINRGEAGIEEWLRALRDHHLDWKVYLPDQGEGHENWPTVLVSSLGDRVHEKSALHLGVSIRAFRSEEVSAAIGALLSADSNAARLALKSVVIDYPMVITRSVDSAKAWVRRRARGTERYGVLASSSARRLKAIGVVVNGDIDPCCWFLNPAEDVRSSYYMEDVASEFDVQGLELDWCVVVWDGDLVREGTSWRCRTFRGTAWQEVPDERKQKYRLNAYRVLLTRARQGLVIVVPEGDSDDPTRTAEFYDPTWDYLVGVGFLEI